MSTPLTLGVFALGLAAVFAGSVGVGSAVGPVGSPAGGEHDTASHADPEHAGEQAADQPEGLSSSLAGVTLQLESATHPQGRTADLAFRVLGPDGDPITSFTPTHDEELHLVVVRRDGTGFQHVHPDRDASGRWSTPLSLPGAGSYKVFADTAPEGRADAITLAADLSVAGDYQPLPPPPVSRTTQVDGYTVTLDGELVAGTTSRLVLSVSRDGRPVTDLEPYLSAYGHLVSLREGDLAYLHTHPDGAPADGRTSPGPDIAFGVEVPTAGTYRLYLDFQHAGVVRTAELTATALAGSARPEGADHGADGDAAHQTQEGS